MNNELKVFENADFGTIRKQQTKVERFFSAEKMLQKHSVISVQQMQF